MTKKFNSVLIIGMGLIGSSISRAMIEYHVANNVYGLDVDDKVVKKCQELNLLIQGETHLFNFNLQFDLVIICTPVSTYEKIFIELNKFITQPTLVTDVGSTKMSTISDFNKINSDRNISFVPSHPIAGLEKSGPEYGFSKLFENRYCILTPFQKEDKAIESISDMWKSCLLYTSPSPRDATLSRMPSSA